MLIYICNSEEQTSLKNRKEKQHMTNREFFTTIASLTNIDSALVEFATNAIAKIDKANATRSAKPSKAHSENVAFIPSITKYLATCAEPVPASKIAENCAISSTNKANAILKIMQNDGVVKVDKIKSTAKSGGKINSYSLIKSEN